MTNNRKSTHRKFKNQKQVLKEALKQKILYKHFCSNATMVFKYG